MNYGLYSAFLGMRARQRTLDTVANNIANAETSGFKTDRLFHHSIEAAEARMVGGKPVIQAPLQNGSSQLPAASDGIQRAFGLVSGGTTDFSTGAFKETGRALDVALPEEGFLVVQTPRGERYTRAGALTIDASGQLVTHRGELIVGQGGPITLRPGPVSVGEDGSIASGGQVAGQLKIVKFSDPKTALTKEGDSLFSSTGTEKPQEVAAPKVASGVLEMSNVNVVSEMAVMMQNSREFDSLQRSVSMMMGDIGRKISSEIGKI